MEITWTKLNPEIKNSAFSGVDEEGNTYFRIGWGGTTYICTLKGTSPKCEGVGSTADEAYKYALKKKEMYDNNNY